jgi:DNA-binding MarR family transcriptional regulator
MDYEQLKLANQLCFPIYAASRLMTREYQPYLDELGITYPQYLVLMVLWERDGITIHDISEKLILNTNTLTPLLKRMEQAGILKRDRSGNDERKVMISLTESGREMRSKASSIPVKMLQGLLQGSLSQEKITELRETLTILMSDLQKNSQQSTT